MKYNAKAIFTCKIKPLRVVFCKIYIILEETALHLLITHEKVIKKIVAPYDEGFLNAHSGFDPHYFASLLMTCSDLKNAHINFKLVLPSQWILSNQSPALKMPNHQLEREFILSLQKKDHLDVKSYAFFYCDNLKNYFAVKKEIIFNFYAIFKQFKQHGCVQFLTEDFIL